MKDDADPVDFIKFGGTRNDFEGKFDSGTRLSSYTVDDLPSRSGDQHPGNSVPACAVIGTEFAGLGG